VDADECRTLIAAARDQVGRTPVEICEALNQADAAFTQAAQEKFTRKGEW
jgi:hypothetical protein